jgi:hypothetical protein
VDEKINGTETPSEFAGVEYCLHEIKPEIVSNPTFGPDAMKLTFFGHKLGEPDSNDELFSMVTGVPNGAIFASRMLDSVDGADQLTQTITAIALQREIATVEAAKGNKVEQPNPMDLLGALFGSMGGMVVPLDDDGEPVEGDEREGEKVEKAGVKFATGDDPIRLLTLGNPDGRPTFAPIDNRNEFPEDMGGYL